MANLDKAATQLGGEMKKNIYIAPSADVLGDVKMEDAVSIWYHATVRADSDKISIGAGSNVQDNCVVHVNEGCPVKIGSGVTIGHSAVVHGCTIGDNTLVGMGAILLNGCKIGANCIIGAGTLVTQNTEIPDGSVVLGNPGKIRRSVTEKDIAHIRENAEKYKRLAAAELPLWMGTQSEE